MSSNKPLCSAETKGGNSYIDKKSFIWYMCTVSYDHCIIKYFKYQKLIMNYFEKFCIYDFFAIMLKSIYVTFHGKTGAPGNDCGNPCFKIFNWYNQLLLVLGRLSLVELDTIVYWLSYSVA